MEKNLQQIISKTRILYLTYGIKSVTMDDVAGELGISKKTLYQHVTDKADLVRKVILNEHEQLLDEVSSLLNKGLNAIEELLEVSRLLTTRISRNNPSVQFDLKKYYPKLYAEINEIKQNLIYDSVVKNMQKGKREGLYRRDLTIEIIAAWYVLRIENQVTPDRIRLIGSGSFTTEEIFNEIFIYHLRGICSTTGISFLDQKLKQLKNNQ